MSEAHARVLDLIFGRWRSQILYTGVKLGIFDCLGEDPRSSDQVADELSLDPSLTYRLMRALGSLELVSEDMERKFSLTEAGRHLRSDHPQSLRGVTLLEEGPEHYAIWKHLPAMIRHGKQNAFVREFGRMAFEHAVQDPGYAQVFDQAMSSYSRTQADWVLEALQSYDFSGIERLCDVGGGRGYLLCRLLQQYPNLSGTVLERPEVIEDTNQLWAEKMGVSERCEYQPGNMFESLPQADAYLMKLILHDWNDEECVQILQIQHRSAPPEGRVFILEHIVPGPSTPHFSKLFDIHMMCWGTGRERTQEEYAALLERAGWEYIQTWFPSSQAMGVLEGAKLS